LAERPFYIKKTSSVGSDIQKIFEILKFF